MHFGFESAIKKINKLRKKVSKAQGGNKSAIKSLTRRLGPGVENNLDELDANLELISSELSTATIVGADADYVARRLEEGAVVGAYVDSEHPDTIFVNPELIGSKLGGILVHEAAHLAGIGHQTTVINGIESIVYGGAASRSFAQNAGYSGARDNASNYGCAVYFYAKNC